MKSHDLLKLLKDKSIDLTKEELEKIIDIESGKSSDEMDANLIEYCLDALSEKEAKEKPQKKLPVKNFFFAGAAAVLILVCVSMLPKLGQAPSFQPTQTTDTFTDVTTQREETTITSTEITDGCAVTEKEETTKDDSLDGALIEKPSLKGDAPATISLKALLELKGFKNVYLPKEISNTVKMTSQTFEENTAKICLKKENFLAEIFIEKTTKPTSSNGREINVNGLSVFVEAKGDESLIKYFQNNLQYIITLDVKEDMAIKIAETIEYEE